MLVRCALIEKPILFEDADEVFDVLLSVTDGWRFSRTFEAGPPLIGIIRHGGGFEITEEGHETFCEDSAVSAACSLIAILLNRMVEDDAGCLCLHAGAVSLGGPALVFPSTHRAGKSTLATALAFQGATLLADDILPLDCTDATIRAIASGVAPRLRLPLSRSLGPRFRFSAWRLAGPGDGYYGYIRLPSLNRQPLGVRHIPGAFIFLERSDENITPQLHAVSKASAMRMLLLQNFGTAAPSEMILERIDRLAEETPAFLLRYGRLASAVALLRRHFSAGASVRMFWSELDRAEPNIGQIGRLGVGKPGAYPSHDLIISHGEGVVLREAEDSIFLANGRHGEIFALDPLGAAIWRFLEEPASTREIAASISAVYPGVAPARIAADVESLINALLAKELVRRVN